MSELARIQAALLKRPPPLPAGPGLRPAAVLVPLLLAEDGVQILLTRRAEGLRQHAGQVSFPGGKQEQTDASLTETALREAEEEISLARESVEIKGFLPSIETGTNFGVLPVVGGIRLAAGEQLADRLASLTADKGEVAAFWAEPVARFLNQQAYEQTEMILPDQRIRRFWQVAGSEPVIWGATARILKNLADRVALPEPG